LNPARLPVPPLEQVDGKIIKIYLLHTVFSTFFRKV